MNLKGGVNLRLIEPHGGEKRVKKELALLRINSLCLNIEFQPLGAKRRWATVTAKSDFKVTASDEGIKTNFLICMQCVLYKSFLLMHIETEQFLM